MGMQYMTTVGVGFEVPLERIRAVADGVGNYGAGEALEKLLWEGEYKYLSVASAHYYDAADTETTFVVAIKRLTQNYDEGDSFGLVVLDPTPIDLTRDEANEVEMIQRQLGIHPTPVVQFVASAVI